MRDKILFAIAALALMALVAEFARSQTRVAPEQIRLPRVVVLQNCTKPQVGPVTVMNPDGTTTTTPGSNCAGLYYIDVVTPAGTELRLVGSQAPAMLDAADWTSVP